ncbi:DUF1800 domain-containing protein [Terracidiphilus sp.]|jgi:uncharacterized protein (DUF1800 family)|uniref:DUF1800 domain-containing protein n=1 Tax=Terracidiphilus sp. TaxID=1964191 RepID=UPI003C2A8F0B
MQPPDRFVARSMAAVMCLCLGASTLPQPALAAAPAAFDRSGLLDRFAARPGKLTSDERILHALNRFTFGLRPGDLKAVKAMGPGSTGLDRWFAQQLHPGSMDNSALQARLAEYPAMQWSSEDILARLPSGAVIRQVIDGKAAMPASGAVHTVYVNQVARVSYRREQDKLKQQTTANATPATNAAPVASAMASNAMSSASAQPPQAAASSMNGVATNGQAGSAQGGSANAMAVPGASPAQPQPAETLIEPGFVDSILALPPSQRVQTLTALPQPRFDAFLKALKGPQRAALLAGLSPDLKETVGALENPEKVVVDELLSQRLTRDIYSEAQLQEVMTDFWFNHFNVYLRKDEATPYYLVSYERDVIRPNSLGKFEDLLEAVAHSPAMLLYLDNSSSTGPDSTSVEKATQAAVKKGNKKFKPEGLNENYARELMELHTLGVNGGYSQADVIQAARILTGWTVDRPQRGGGFKYDANRHEPGTNKVMGKKFKDKGEQEGRNLLHFLSTRPATAKFISRKLAIRFVSDDPPQSLVDRMAKTFLHSDGDIAAVLETLYRSPEFWSSNTYRAKIKTPLEYVVSASRASNANIANMQPLMNALRDMGMPLYGSIPPTGYKWDAADWVSTGALVNRMNFALSLTANKLNGITTKWPESASAVPQSATQSDAPKPSPESEEARLESLLVGGGVSETTRSAVLQQFTEQSAQVQPAAPDMAMQADKLRTGGKQVVAVPAVLKPQPNHLPPASPIEKQDQLLAGLLLGSPEFQRR